MNPPSPRARSRTGRDDLDASLAELVGQIAPDANVDLITEILATGIRLGLDDTDRLDLKITNAALKEMRARVPHLRPVRRRAEGDDLRVGPHPARGPAVRADPQPGLRHGRRGMDGRSPVPARGSCRPAWRAPVASSRSA